MVTTVFGIDYGLTRVGVAVGNTLTRSAQPLQIIERTDDHQVIANIATLVQHWQAQSLAIGIPRHPDDTPHQMTAACLAFAQLLREQLGLLVVEVDERYSSAVLPQTHKRHKNGNIRNTPLDDKAAAIILQQYLDQL